MDNETYEEAVTRLQEEINEALSPIFIRALTLLGRFVNFVKSLTGRGEGG